MWGVSRQAVHDVEKSALKKLVSRLKEAGAVELSLKLVRPKRRKPARNPNKKWGGKQSYPKPKWPVMVEVIMWQEQIQMMEVGR